MFEAFPVLVYVLLSCIPKDGNYVCQKIFQHFMWHIPKSQGYTCKNITPSFFMYSVRNNRVICDWGKFGSLTQCFSTAGPQPRYWALALFGTRPIFYKNNYRATVLQRLIIAALKVSDSSFVNYTNVGCLPWSKVHLIHIMSLELTLLLSLY